MGGEASSRPTPTRCWRPTRRGFLKVMGASLALAGLTACRWPAEEIVPFAHRPEGYVPGVPVQYATAMELGGVATGLLVTSYDGRPIKIEGNPLAPGEPRRHRRADAGRRPRAVRPRPQPQRPSARDGGQETSRPGTISSRASPRALRPGCGRAGARASGSSPRRRPRRRSPSCASGCSPPSRRRCGTSTSRSRATPSARGSADALRQGRPHAPRARPGDGSSCLDADLVLSTPGGRPLCARPDGGAARRRRHDEPAVRGRGGLHPDRRRRRPPPGAPAGGHPRFRREARRRAVPEAGGRASGRCCRDPAGARALPDPPRSVDAPPRDGARPRGGTRRFGRRGRAGAAPRGARSRPSPQRGSRERGRDRALHRRAGPRPGGPDGFAPHPRRRDGRGARGHAADPRRQPGLRRARRSRLRQAPRARAERLPPRPLRRRDLARVRVAPAAGALPRSRGATPAPGTARSRSCSR